MAQALCMLDKATNTHVTRIAVSLQQWLKERASFLGYTYITCSGDVFMEGYN